MRGQVVADTMNISWAPSGGVSMTPIDGQLVDVTDGDTPNMRMPIRMLSVDTPEVTARSTTRAEAIDAEFTELAGWIRQGIAPISPPLAAFLLPKLETGQAGSLQFTQGKNASEFTKTTIDTRLARPNGSRRSLFVRVAQPPFDSNGRLLGYVAPNYSKTERDTMTLAQRATFNLNLLEAGWAAPFVIYPSIPADRDLALLLDATTTAQKQKRGIWAEPNTLLAYEYRAMEKLHRITKKIHNGEPLKPGEDTSWRERHCADMRTRTLHGPEDYAHIPPAYRLWIWPSNLTEATTQLKLTPAP